MLGVLSFAFTTRLLQTNMMAAGLASANLVLYAFVYTPLKQLHPVNTWVGAVVGAIPPLLGYNFSSSFYFVHVCFFANLFMFLSVFVGLFRWAAASGEISYNSMILPAALYFWQIPHFMALAHLCRDDYTAGG